MRKTMVGVMLAATFLMYPTASYGDETVPSKPVHDDARVPDWAKLAASSNVFARNLYAQLASGEGNLFFSPDSLHMALAMTYAGARGRTAEQMHDALDCPREPDLPVGQDIHHGSHWVRGPRWPQEKLHVNYRVLQSHLTPGRDAGYQLSVANALWGQKGYPWLEDFLATTKHNYAAGLREVDFIGETEAARRTINQWVEDQTKEKIKDLLAPGILDRFTRLVLTNAIYFKGNWASQFKKADTKDEPFHLSADGKVTVPMMHQTHEFGYAETTDLQVLSMPYVGKELSMVIYLPKKADELAALEESLPETLAAGEPEKLRRREVRVSVPRFKMTSEFRLKDTLSAMGMTDAFDSKTADFSGMTTEENLFISAVVHKAFVDVNEEGTEAAAATAVVMEAESVEAPPPVFRADHPFLFLIRHEKTGVILFMGRVMNPNA